jgi:hypothetical protein
MASTIIDPAAQAIADIATGLAVDVTVTGSKWAPRDLSNLPAIVVELPEVRRAGLAGEEPELYADGWWMTFDCILYVELVEAASSQTTVVDIAEAFIAAIDADPSLGITRIEEARVTSAGPAEITVNEPRALLQYPLTVELLRLVP